MKLATRARVAASLVLGIVAVGTVATATVYPSPAYAAASTFTGAGNLTVLPSTAQPLLTGVADASPGGQVGQYLYAAMKDPKKMAALTQLYRQAAAGTATTAETAELATAVRASAPVATKMAPLAARALGPAGAVITSAQVGFAIGKGVSSAIGYDTDSGLCFNSSGQRTQFISFVTGTDCTAAIQKLAKDFVPNTDASAGQALTVTTGARNDRTGQWDTGRYTVSLSGTDNGRYCWSVTPSMPDGYSVVVSIVFNAAGGGNGGPASYQILDYQQNLRCGGDQATGKPDHIRVGGTKEYYGNGPETTGAQGGFYSDADANSWQSKPVQSIENTTADPARHQTCKQRYTDGTVDQLIGDSKRLSEGAAMPPEMPVPDGKIVANITCELVPEDGSATPVEDINQDTTTQYQKAATVKPECSSTTVCELQLVKPDGSVCNDTDNTCAGWKESSDAKNYTCRWGNAAVGWSSVSTDDECGYYANRWNPEAQRSGNTLTVPASQSPSKTATPVKNPAPELTPGTDVNVGSTPIKDPDTGRAECFPSGWGALNPVSWVVQPVQCALSWAFVPRLSEVKKAGDGIRKSWDKTAPVKLATAVGGWDFEPAMTGCDGIPLPANLIYKGMPAQRIASACPGTSLAPAATAVKVFLNITFGIGGAWAIASYMGWTIGFKGPAD